MNQDNSATYRPPHVMHQDGAAIFPPPPHVMNQDGSAIYPPPHHVINQDGSAIYPQPPHVMNQDGGAVHPPDFRSELVWLPDNYLGNMMPPNQGLINYYLYYDNIK